MAKSKGKSSGAQNHLRARISYLERAAALVHSARIGAATPASDSRTKAVGEDALTSTSDPETVPKLGDHGHNTKNESTDERTRTAAIRASLPRHYLAMMRGVSLRTQLRLPVPTKRSFCKRCDLSLISGLTSTEEIQNPSRGRRKPWANVRVVRCRACLTEKRFPLTERREKKLALRQKERGTREAE
ncbi:hypothetical protein VTN31DRAFT_6996 [Thermomyces dupontii]|uniref:uncharacterized protein n=1 Tax=Talaromyces thermophilus TaxID=28565 RepID=UPI0037445637